MKLSFLILAISLCLFFSCGSNHQHSEEHTHEDGVTHSHSNSGEHSHSVEHDHADDKSKHEHEPSTQLVLNNGARWEANIETTEGIINMKSILISFNDKDKKNYEDLQSQLQEEFELIFKRCTMTGEAHNQLHNYLLPLKEVMAELESGDEKTVQKLETYLGMYTSFFE